MIRLIAFAALLLMVGPAFGQTPPADPAPEVAPPLPDGPMMLIGGRPEGGAGFLVLDETARNGDVVALTLYAVLHPPVPVDGREVAQLVERSRLDCAARTVRPMASGAYDAADALVVAAGEEPDQPIGPASAHLLVFQVLCEGQTLPPENRVGNRTEAMEIAGQRR